MDERSMVEGEEKDWKLGSRTRCTISPLHYNYNYDYIRPSQLPTLSHSNKTMAAMLTLP